jgi:aryl-alcohol dehydrogenase-like predicted oxidoreductase
MIETREFGRTGHASTRVVLGAAAFSRVDQETADRVMALVDSYGINHIDTAAMYGDSEMRLAPWLADNRDRVFLATKTGERNGDAARAQLERSLERLGVDHVDLIQLHNLVEEDEWAEAHGPGGALEALVRARDEGLARHIGVTGHGLRIARMHLRSLERFHFDSVLFPYNHALLGDPTYRADVEELMAVCQSRQVALQTIKSVAKRRWEPDTTQRKYSWYEPLDDMGALARAVRFVLADPNLFLLTTSDYHVLPAILEAASTPAAAPSDEALDADAAAFGVRRLFDRGDLERI